MLVALLLLGAVDIALPQGDMSSMSGHMYMTATRPLVKPAMPKKPTPWWLPPSRAMEPYKDFHKALADGYEIFLPNIPQPQYHFTKYAYGLQARTHFDPSKPTSLLYTKTADGGYTLVGAMYTDRVDASEDELNDRIPLSIAHWHQHTNFCKAPRGPKGCLFRTQREIRFTRFHHYRGSVRGGRWRISSPHIRMDGPCVSLRNGPEENMVDG